MKKFLFVLIVVVLTINSSYANSLTGEKIGIDAGHGGSDSGAIGPTGLKEKDTALSIALSAQKYLERDGATVIMTRSSDIRLNENQSDDLSARTNYLNSNQVNKAISIHLNAVTDRTVNRTMDFVNCGDCDKSSGSLADNILEKVSISTGLERYGPSSIPCTGLPKECPGKPGVGQANLHMVRETKMPATLVEVSFISNNAEETKLKDNDYLDKQGWAIYAGIAQEYGYTPIPRDGNSGNGNNSLSNIKGIFDGAGSLVSPNEECWGCNKDEARMHPHPGTGSTVVFQWLYDSDTCSQIDLLADSDIEVAIKAKAWDEHLTQKAFKVTLGTNPVTLKRPSDHNSWTTLAITSTNSISDMTRIYAYCKTPSDSYHTGNRESIDNDLVDVTYNYYWTGTGSLITQAEERIFDNAGIGIDYAATFRTKNSLTSFQWYASSQCSKVKIKGYNENSSSINGVHIKGWAEENWSSNKCSSLPCTITAPSTNAYYIIKVKSSPDAIKSGYLETSCVQ